MTIKPDDLTLFGLQLQYVFRFVASGCISEELVIDHVDDQRRLPLSSLFDKTDDRLWVMRSASLPGDTTIKAVACDKARLLLETSPLETEHVAEMLRNNRLPFDFNEEKRTFTLRGRENGHVTYTTPETPELSVNKEDGEGTIKLEPRVMWEVNLENVETADREDILRLFDALDGSGMLERSDEEKMASAAPQSQRLELNLTLQMRMVMEQRAILALRQQMQQRPEMRTEMRLEFQQLLRLEQFTRRASTEQVFSAISNLAEKKNLGVAASVLSFLIARPIKEQRRCDWKTARRIARPIALQAIISAAHAASTSSN